MARSDHVGLAMIRKTGTLVDSKVLILLLVLFMPLGILMDFAHEFGHVLWGIAAGGRLAYFKIAYFEVYPNPALTTTFVLGYVEVDGLGTGFARGLFLLGGSLTSNIVAWSLGPLLLRFRVGYRKEVALKMLGSFGILDLPMYVLLPQIGLQHWVILGGNIPEPLIGARSMGIPDPAFYAAVTFTTLGLLLLYSPRLRSEAAKVVATVTDRLSISRGKRGPTEDLLHACSGTAKAYRLEPDCKRLTRNTR